MIPLLTAGRHLARWLTELLTDSFTHWLIHWHNNLHLLYHLMNLSQLTSLWKNKRHNRINKPWNQRRNYLKMSIKTCMASLPRLFLSFNRDKNLTTCSVRTWLVFENCKPNDTAGQLGIGERSLSCWRPYTQRKLDVVFELDTLSNMRLWRTQFLQEILLVSRPCAVPVVGGGRGAHGQTRQVKRQAMCVCFGRAQDDRFTSSRL